jgi:hypothetical protein
VNTLKSYTQRQLARAAEKVAFTRLMCFFAMALHDQHGFGAVRLWKLFEYIKTSMAAYDEGRISDKDIKAEMERIDFKIEWE